MTPSFYRSRNRGPGKFQNFLEGTQVSRLRTKTRMKCLLPWFTAFPTIGRAQDLSSHLSLGIFLGSGPGIHGRSEITPLMILSWLVSTTHYLLLVLKLGRQRRATWKGTVFPLICVDGKQHSREAMLMGGGKVRSTPSLPMEE